MHPTDSCSAFKLLFMKKQSPFPSSIISTCRRNACFHHRQEGRGYLLPSQQLGVIRRLAPRPRPVGLLLFPQPISALVAGPFASTARPPTGCAPWLGCGCSGSQRAVCTWRGKRQQITGPQENGLRSHISFVPLRSQQPRRVLIVLRDVRAPSMMNTACEVVPGLFGRGW